MEAVWFQPSGSAPAQAPLITNWRRLAAGPGALEPDLAPAGGGRLADGGAGAVEDARPHVEGASQGEAVERQPGAGGAGQAGQGGGQAHEMQFLAAFVDGGGQAEGGGRRRLAAEPFGVGDGRQAEG